MVKIKLSELDLIINYAIKDDNKDKNIFEEYLKNHDGIKDKYFFKYENKNDDIKLAVLASLFHKKNIDVENIVKSNKRFYDIYSIFNKLKFKQNLKLDFFNYENDNQFKKLFNQVIKEKQKEEVDYYNTTLTLNLQQNKINIFNKPPEKDNNKKIIIYNIDYENVKKTLDFFEYKKKETSKNQIELTDKLIEYINKKQENTELIKLQEELQKLQEDLQKDEKELKELNEELKELPSSIQIDDNSIYLNIQQLEYELNKLNYDKRNVESNKHQLLFNQRIQYQQQIKLIEDEIKKKEKEIEQKEKELKQKQEELNKIVIKKDTTIKDKYKQIEEKQKQYLEEFKKFYLKKTQKYDLKFKIKIEEDKLYEQDKKEFNKIISGISSNTTSDYNHNDINKYGYFFEFILNSFRDIVSLANIESNDDIQIDITNYFKRVSNINHDTYIIIAKEFIEKFKGDINNIFINNYKTSNISKLNLEDQIYFYQTLIYMILIYNIYDNIDFINLNSTSLNNIIKTNFYIIVNTNTFNFNTSLNIKKNIIELINLYLKTNITSTNKKTDYKDNINKIFNYFNLSELYEDKYNESSHVFNPTYEGIIVPLLKKKIHDYKLQIYDKIDEYEKKYGKELGFCLSCFKEVIDYYSKEDLSDIYITKYLYNLSKIKFFYELLSDEQKITNKFKPSSLYISISNSYYNYEEKKEMNKNQDGKQLKKENEFDSSSYKNVVEYYINDEQNLIDNTENDIFNEKGNLNLVSIIYICNGKYMCIFKNKNDWILYNSHSYDGNLFIIKDDDIKKKVILLLPDNEDFKIYEAIPVSFIYMKY